MTTDLTVTGKPAQFGRGLLNDVGGKITEQFADNLAATLRAATVPAAAGTSSGDQAPLAGPALAAPGTAVNSTEPLDLMEVAGGAVAKRVIVGALGSAAVVALVVLAYRSLR